MARDGHPAHCWSLLRKNVWFFDVIVGLVAVDLVSKIKTQQISLHTCPGSLACISRRTFFSKIKACHVGKISQCWFSRQRTAGQLNIESVAGVYSEKSGC